MLEHTLDECGSRCGRAPTGLDLAPANTARSLHQPKLAAGQGIAISGFGERIEWIGERRLRSVGAWKCACEAIGGQRSTASRNAGGGVAPCARMACVAREGMTQRSSALV